MVKPLLTCLALAAVARSLALPQDDEGAGSSAAPDFSFTTASCQDGALTRANAAGADRWRDGKATSAWNYMRNVFFSNEGTKPEDYEFTSMGISDFFHQGDGIRCGATGQDDTSCKSLQFKCEDLAGQPVPEDIQEGTYPAAFLIMNSISNLNDVSKSQPAPSCCSFFFTRTLWAKSQLTAEGPRPSATCTSPSRPGSGTRTYQT